MAVSDSIERVEEIIFSLGLTPSDDSIKAARLSIRAALQEFAGLEINEDLTLGETFEEINKKCRPDAIGPIAIVLLRLLATPNVLPENTQKNQIHRRIVSLVEHANPHFLNRFKLQKDQQTYEKIDSLSGIFPFVRNALDGIRSFSTDINAIRADRQSLLKEIGDSSVNEFLQPYDFRRIRKSVESILSRIVELEEGEDTLFPGRVRALSEFLEEEATYSKEFNSFLYRDIYQSFLQKRQKGSAQRR